MKISRRAHIERIIAIILQYYRAEPDDIMPCGCCSGSCYCDADWTWETEAI